MDLTDRVLGTTFQTSDNTIATVDLDGVVSAVNNGTTTLQVANRGTQATVTVIVDVTPFSLDVAPNPVNLFAVGATQQLRVLAELPGASEPLDVTAGSRGTTYTPVNPSIATVSADGLVTGVAGGRIIINVANRGVTVPLTVDVNVGDNRPPQPAGDTIERYPTQSVKVAIAELLLNDNDPDPDDAVLFDSVISNGAIITVIGDKVFYDPQGHFGADTFDYVVKDTFDATATATVQVNLIDDISKSLNIKFIRHIAAGTFEIVFAGIPGESYTIQFSPIVSPANWETIGTANANAAGEFRFTYTPTPLGTAGCFRSVKLGTE